MSKHFIEINFEQLKFNLYELLGVSSDSSETKIKKSYRKLVIKFHPDKNNLLDEEIYNHLTIANQVLTNPELRHNYDEWILTSVGESLAHITLKQKFEDSVSQVDNNLQNKLASMPTDVKTSYHEKVKSLNQKHGFNPDNWDDETTLNRYDRRKKEMDEGILINQDNIKNEKEFNNKFDNIKSDDDNHQIIKSHSKKEILEYNGEIIGDQYLSIKSYDMLYSNDETQSNNYSSLDRAFSIQPKIEFKEQNVSEKMKEYKNLSKNLENLYPKATNV